MERKNAWKTAAPAASPKRSYGDYGNVLLTEEEFSKLKREFPEDWQQRVEALSAYMKSKGTVYKDHLATIRNWARRDAERNGGAPRAPKQGSAEDLQRSYNLLADFVKEDENGNN